MSDARADRRERRLDRRLGRYSRAVRILRILLPLGALALLSSIFLITRDTFPAGVRFTAADVEAFESGLRLTEPRFTGTTDAGEPFMLRADWALPDAPDPSEIELAGIEAEIHLADGRQARLVAARGVLRPKAQTVALEGEVAIRTSDGYTAMAPRAVADLRARILTVPEPLIAEGPLGRIEAGRLVMRRPSAAEQPAAEEVIVFEDKVRVIYTPAEAPAAPEGR
ncbi:MAG: hypothetical protein AAFR46_00835 [Pseudomonadota bacterium]